MEILLLVATMYSDTGITASGIHTDDIAGPWVAMPEGGDWQFNDLIAYRTVGSDGIEHFGMARVLDMGPFGDNCVMQPDGLCASIVMDIPGRWWQHGRDTSARVTYWQNITAKAREAGEW